MTKEQKVKALQRLRPGAVFGVTDELVIVDMDNPPSEAEIQNEINAIRNEALIQEIKQEANKKIVEVFPEWKQRNMLAELAAINNKETKTADDLKRISEMETVWAWVNDVRSVSNDAETAKTPIENISWPSFPLHL